MDVPTRIDDRDELIALLRLASELEHALTCQYLYAAFTLKQGGDPGLTPSQAALVDHWDQQITKIAAQEMYHLMLASNLLTALDAEPHLWHPNFPQPPKHFSDIALPSELACFGPETVHRFMCWEKPEEHGWWDKACRSCAAAATSRLGFAMISAEDAPFSTIGQLYRVIEDAFLAHSDWIDPGQADRQVTSTLVPFVPSVGAVLTPADASRHIDVIIEQGEGAAKHDSQAHFAFFHQIVDELAAAATSAPSWPTVDNPIYDAGDAGPGTTLVDDPTASPLGLLFNDVYLLLLRTLTRLFVPEGESSSQRATLANAAMAFMPLVIKPLGTLLTRLPAGKVAPGRYAGPSFELPQVVPSAVGAASDVWAELEDAMTEATVKARLLAIEHGTAAPEMERVAANMETLTPLFALDPASVT